MTDTHYQQDRKLLFVNQPVQGQLLRRSFASWIVYHVLLWHSLFLFQWMQNGLGGAAVTFSEAYKNFSLNNYPIAIVALISLPMFLKTTMKLSHSIVGPLVPIVSILRKIRQGESVQPVQLRKSDLTSSLQQELNEFVTWYNFNHSPNRVAQEQSSKRSPSEADLLKQVADLKKTTQGIRALSDEDFTRRPN